MPSKEFNEAIVDLDQPMEEFRDLAEGASTDALGRRILFTEELMRCLAGEALATIRYHAKRGSLRAAMYLVDRCLGVPDQPFSQTVEQMTPEEAEAALLAEYRRQGFTEEVCQGLVGAARQIRGTAPDA